MPASAWARRCAPSKRNGVGHNADRQRAELAGNAGDDRRGTGAGTTALTGGDEDEIGAPQGLTDLLVRLLGGLAADLGTRTGAKALGQLVADVDALGCTRGLQLLGIGVDRDELDVADTGLDHAVHGVDAGTTDADDADHGEIGVRRQLAGQRRALDVTAGKGCSGARRLSGGGVDGIGHGLDVRGDGRRRRHGLHRRGRRLHQLRVLDGLLAGRLRRLRGVRRAEQVRERTVMHAGSLIRHG
jgi:hypothetical protein